MNDIIFVKKYDALTEEKFKKSLYRSIIYNFLCETCVKTDCNTFKISPNNLVVIPKNTDFTIENTEGACSIVLQIEDESFPTCGEVLLHDIDRNLIGASVKESEIYYNSELFGKETILDGLGGLIAACLVFKIGKSGNLSIVKVIDETLQANIGNCDFKIDDFFKTLPINGDYAKKIYKNQTGRTPKEYLIKLRLNKARAFLSGRDRFDYTIKQIAAVCGYKDPLYFSKQFKKRFLSSPEQYAHRFDKPIVKNKTPIGNVIEDDI